MRIGIVGSGNIGGAAARLLAAAGHEVALSHKGKPESLREQVAQLGAEARAMTVDEAIAFGDVILLALPWRDRSSLPADKLAGKVVIDATNHYRPDLSLYDLGGSTSSEEVRRAIPRARLVKALNTLAAKELGSLGRPDLPPDERIALFIAGDDGEAKAIVSKLVEEIGFTPIDAGSLREGGRLQQPPSPITGRSLVAKEARAALDRVRGAGAGAPAQR